MLVLTRRLGEEIVIDGDIRLTVLESHGSAVRLGITAPESVRVLRQEILDRQAKSAAASVSSAEISNCSSDSKIMSRLIRTAR